MNPYSKEDLKLIQETKETNDRMEDFLTNKRNEWNNNIQPLFEEIKINFTKENSHKLIDLQATALAYRQNMNEEISYFLNRRSKEDTKFKQLKQEKLIYYAIGFGLKTNTSEKTILLEGHLAESERTLLLIETHIEFLRQSSKNLESLGFTIKNINELLNYLSGIK